MRTPFIAALLPVVCVLLTAACFDDSGGGVYVPSLVGFQLQPPAVTIAVGDTVQIHATPIDEDGEVYDTIPPGWLGIHWYATVGEVVDTLDFMPANPIKVIGASPGQTDICPSAEGISRECAAVTVEARPMSLK